MVWIGCHSNRIDVFPQQILGEWETSAPRFKGFTFILTDRTIVFVDKNAEEQREVCPISKIERIAEGDKILYIIFYHNKEDVKLKFAFYYENESGGMVRLKNQKSFSWKKKGKNFS